MHTHTHTRKMVNIDRLLTRVPCIKNVLLKNKNKIKVRNENSTIRCNLQVGFRNSLLFACWISIYKSI